MDRISALRTIEEALTDYEEGEVSLPALEREVRGVLRTYATAFDEEATVYRAESPVDVEGVAVVATSPGEAREQVADLAEDVDDARVTVERV
ncbi:MAG: hypothetical protein BRD23_08860 [Halobacteriales archaeon SW_9_67_25]|jgi:hypothetical protein|nr:MAG: hypothetical protein BRD23_08860 [Halobacteriales archaeon SW_9_67_25]